MHSYAIMGSFDGLGSDLDVWLGGFEGVFDLQDKDGTESWLLKGVA